MPDITSVLERAAAEPTRGPDLERPWRARRTKHVAAGGTAIVAVLVFALVLAPQEPRARSVQVSGPAVPTTPGQPAVVHSDNASLSVPPGWHVASEPHAWWLSSPKELFSVSSSPLPASPRVEENEAICPSEIPRAVAENMPVDGAYLWIGKWQQGGVGYTASPRKPFSELEFHPLCDLPRGLVARSATLSDGRTDYVVYYIEGPDTPNYLLQEVTEMVDGLRFDG